MKTDNELIAEFMGGRHISNNKITLLHETLPQRVTEGANGIAISIWIDDLEYHTSWDWLMPVVEKISEYRLAYPEQADKVCNAKIVIRIKYLYPLVVEFVKFLNSQSQSK